MAIGRIPEPGTGIPESIIAAKGDLLTGTANDTPAVLTVGANGTTLVADSSEAVGLRWAAPAGGGKVLQVVQGTTTTTVGNSTSTFEDTTLTATITPSSATSKVLIMAMNSSIGKTAANQANEIGIRLMRNATQVGTEIVGLYTNTAIINTAVSAIFNYLDSPATTSATTYKTQFRNTNNTAAVGVQNASAESTIILMEIGA